MGPPADGPHIEPPPPAHTSPNPLLNPSQTPPNPGCQVLVVADKYDMSLVKERVEKWLVSRCLRGRMRSPGFKFQEVAEGFEWLSICQKFDLKDLGWVSVTRCCWNECGMLCAAGCFTCYRIACVCV